MTGPPSVEPIGLQLTRTAKVVSRAFDGALAAAGGSLPVWLVLTSLKAQQHAMQRDIADELGIEGATLTHHLNRMERAGLVTRGGTRRTGGPTMSSSRVSGEAMFFGLLETVAAFDRPLRAGLGDDDLAVLGGLLARLRANVGAEETR